jgi:hypothetical protein
MTHPDSYIVGMLGLAVFAVGAITIMTGAAVTGLQSHRFLPLYRSRTLFWIGMPVLLALPLAILLVAARAMQALAVIASFGWDAYADGVRVINKHGELSSGGHVSAFWAAAIGAGTVLLMLLAVVPLTVWVLHFHRNRDPRTTLQVTGMVRLNGQPLPRALVTFYLVAGEKRRGYIAVRTDATGCYQVYDLPLKTFRITIADNSAQVSREYSDPARTPLEFVGTQLGVVTHNLDLPLASRLLPA